MTATESKWSERVRGWRASGQSASEYAQGRGFAPTTLTWWASHLGKVPSKSDSTVRMLPVVRATRSGAACLMVRVGAAQIEVGAGFDASLLRDIVDALGVAS